MSSSQPSGRLGILLPGLGAVGSTLIAGVLAARNGLGSPIGSLSQLGRVDPGDGQQRPIRELVDLASLDDIVFGGWDPITPNALEAARTSGVLGAEHLDALSGELEGIVPMDAVFDRAWVSRLDGVRVKSTGGHWASAEALIDDIARFRAEHAVDRVVMVWCGSTEAFSEPCEIHDNLAAFEAALQADDPRVAPSQIYAYAALQSDVPVANGSPNLMLDLPCMVELAESRGVPIAGRDFKTGQTLMKTILAPGLRARMLGIRGWYSTNILGNRDGYVLDDPANFRTKELSKLGVLESILEPDVHPDLYGELDHVVRINYYPPRGDDKEGWDNIDIFGWLGYPMQIKVDFLCRDSILAAPLALDLVLFSDLAQRAKLGGIQEWLSFYYKSPQVAPGLYPEHDLFIQLTKLKNTLRWMMGEEQITHLGREYYDEV